MSPLRLVGPIDRILYMKSLPTLQGMGLRETAQVARHAREMTFRQGETILDAESELRTVHIVVSGIVRVTRRGVRLLDCGPTDNIGLLAALARDRAGLEAVAETDLVTLAIEFEALLDLFEENFQLLQNTIRNLAVFQRAMLEHVVDGSVRRPWFEFGPHRQGRSIDLVQRLLLLRQGGVFRRIGLEALALMASGMEEQVWPEGHVFWERGDPSGQLFVIVSGEVECELDARYGSFRAGLGYPLGNLETLGQSPRWYRPVALTPVVTLRGNHETFFDVLEDDFDVALDFIAAMAAGALDTLEQLSGRSQGTLAEFFRRTLRSDHPQK